MKTGRSIGRKSPSSSPDNITTTKKIVPTSDTKIYFAPTITEFNMIESYNNTDYRDMNRLSLAVEIVKEI